MKFLYATDLHGKVNKYDTVFKTAVEHEIELIHLGADILPKGSNILEVQKNFVKGYLKEFYSKCNKKGITVLASFGNDDIPTRRFYFHKYAQSLDQHPHIKEGYKFTAYNFVPDYPFGLKCACKADYPGWKLKESYNSTPVEANLSGFYPIDNIEEYFKKKGSIEEDLKDFPADSKTIVAIHCPPQGLELDLCANGSRVGSKAIRDWIEAHQPLIALCGHIHEAPRYNGGIWKAEIGKTLVIQPGQDSHKTTMALIEIKEGIQAWRLSL